MLILTSKQIEATELHGSDATRILLAGGTRSGKTVVNLRDLIVRAIKCKSNHVVFRKTFNHLKTSVWHGTLPFVLQHEFPDVPVKFNRSDFFIEFYNGSRIWFAGLDSKERTEKILGNEYSTIFFEECSQISWESHAIAMSRLAEKTALKNKVYYGCNPPSMSHWVYRLFIEKVDPESRKPLPFPEDYAYLLMNPKDNEANISKDYVARVLGSMSDRDQARFLRGEFSSDIKDAIFTSDLIMNARIYDESDWFPAKQIAIGLDPATTGSESSDLHGISVVSSDGKTANVLADYSLRSSPDVCVTTILNVYDKYKANFIVYEGNQGGDWIAALLKTKNRNISLRKVHAKTGKHVRAEPVVALYEQGKVKHAKSGLAELEREMLEYVPLQTDKSPDRLDALVYAVTSLVLDAKSYGITAC